jgi:hypothetical protein
MWGRRRDIYRALSPQEVGAAAARVDFKLSDDTQSAGLQTVLRKAYVSRDGRRLVASSDDSGLAIFDLTAERLIGAIYLGEVRHLDLAADGKVALVEGRGRILLIDLDPKSWSRKAKQLVSR